MVQDCTSETDPTCHHYGAKWGEHLFSYTLDGFGIYNRGRVIVLDSADACISILILVENSTCLVKKFFPHICCYMRKAKRRTQYLTTFLEKLKSLLLVYIDDVLEIIHTNSCFFLFCFKTNRLRLGRWHRLMLSNRSVISVDARTFRRLDN